jgi:hypothetical protein
MGPKKKGRVRNEKENRIFFGSAMESITKLSTETFEAYFLIGKIVNSLVRLGFQLKRIAEGLNNRINAKKLGRCRNYWVYLCEIHQLWGSEIYPMFTFPEYVSKHNIKAIVELAKRAGWNLETANVEVRNEENLITDIQFFLKGV